MLDVKIVTRKQDYKDNVLPIYIYSKLCNCVVCSAQINHIACKIQFNLHIAAIVCYAKYVKISTVQIVMIKYVCTLL